MKHLPTDIGFRRLIHDPAAVPEWQRLLSDEEGQRMATFRSMKRRHEFVQGRAVLRYLLAEQLDCAPEAVQVQVADDGGLDLIDHPLHISLAHADDTAVAVASPRRVGVDLERIQPRHPHLRRFLLHPDEYPLLDELDLDTDRALMLCWTLKEATLKALRTGFRISPKTLRLSINMDTRIAKIHHVDGAVDWYAHFAEQEGYYVAVAVPEE